jgi:class 3 adenylate cyclase
VVAEGEQLSLELGDEAAADLAVSLALVVNKAAQQRGGRPVKWLGDGVMFHFSDPGNAVPRGLDLLEQTENSEQVPVRIGINAGAVIPGGDFFGRTVNVAARIAYYALVVDQQPVVLHRARPVRLHRATRA